MTDKERLEHNSPLGLYGGREGAIWVDTGSDPAEIADTLLHETLHAIWRHYALDDNAEEERAVTLLAHGLTQVLRDNRDLLTFLEAHTR
jgi:hypothetical protein